MSNSQTQICNRGLQKLGAARLLDISDDSRNGRAMKAAYEPVRRAELRKHFWRFAIKRVTLSPVVGFTSDEYSYAFQLPSDYLRMIKPRDPFNDIQLEGNRILTNLSSTLELRYIADITDPTLFDANFSEVFSTALAIETCEEITQSNTKIEALKRDYKIAMSDAKQFNAFETIPVEPEDDSWWIARR